MLKLTSNCIDPAFEYASTILSLNKNARSDGFEYALAMQPSRVYILSREEDVVLNRGNGWSAM